MKAIVKKPEKILLIYGLSDEEQSKLEEDCRQVQIICRKVTDADASLKVGQLLQNNIHSQHAGHKTDGKFALMSGFDDESRPKCMHMINLAAKGVIKAVVTPYNTDWKFSDLCEHLTEEQRYMTQK